MSSSKISLLSVLKGVAAVGTLGASAFWLSKRCKQSGGCCGGCGSDKFEAELKVSQEELVKEFEASFDRFSDEFVAESATKYEQPEYATKRLKEMCMYTCIGGKMNRGMLSVNTVLDLCRIRNLSFNKRKEQAFVLGWCIEILQACFLVADDIMDASETRRGQPCWYKREDVQLDAINDSLILESFIYFLLKKYFDKHPAYVTLLEMYHEVSYQTQLGQMIDLLSQPQGKKGIEVLNRFSLDMHTKIVQYKTAYYTFYLPMASAMVVCGMNSARELKVANDLSVALGVKFQIEDDYLDCYGDPAHIGKVGTDIKDHKCTWLVVQALQRVSPEQRKVLETCYGKEDAESEAKIKQLYRDLDLQSVYEEQEQRSYDAIVKMMEDNADVVPSVIFRRILDKIHMRTK